MNSYLLVPMIPVLTTRVTCPRAVTHASSVVSSHHLGQLVVFVQGNDEKGKQILISQRAVGMVHCGMIQKVVCQQLGISRSQLHVWVKRDELGLGLQMCPAVAARPLFTG